MKKLFSLLGLAMILAYPVISQAREVTFTTQLKNYRGDGAYLALYLTDANGEYQQTLWIAGGKDKYYKHLTDWRRGSQNSQSEYDGLTGASITQGQVFRITVDLEERLIDKGYQVRVDTAVEDMRDNPSDINVTLTTEGAGIPAKGYGYVDSLMYEF